MLMRPDVDIHMRHADHPHIRVAYCAGAGGGTPSGCSPSPVALGKALCCNIKSHSSSPLPLSIVLFYAPSASFTSTFIRSPRR